MTLNKVYKAAVVAATFALLAGCSSVNTSQPTNALIGRVDSSVKADVAVGEKIHGEATAKVLFGFIKWGEGNHYADGVNYGTSDALSLVDASSSAKSAAAYNAVQASGADLIVAPRYTVTVNSYVLYKTVHVKVDGYKGTIAGIH